MATRLESSKSASNEQAFSQFDIIVTPHVKCTISVNVQRKMDIRVETPKDRNWTLTSQEIDKPTVLHLALPKIESAYFFSLSYQWVLKTDQATYKGMWNSPTRAWPPYDIAIEVFKDKPSQKAGIQFEANLSSLKPDEARARLGKDFAEQHLSVGNDEDSPVASTVGESEVGDKKSS
jgi:hypothetical protein